MSDKPENVSQQNNDKNVERVNPKKGFCNYYFEKKGRFCGMQVRKIDTENGKVYNKYCTHHDPDNNRIVCPLDSSHTVYIGDLQAHLKRCPGLKKKQKFEDQPFIKKGINGGSADEILEIIKKSSTPEIPLDARPSLIDRIKAAGERYKVEFDLPVEELKSEAVESFMKEGIQGSVKHTPQLSSIVSHIYNTLPQDALDTPCFVEFGAGKAKLSQALAMHMKGKGHFVLLDRAHFHHKSDKMLRIALNIDGKETKVDASSERISADIIDFDLSGSEKANQSNIVVGIGKHVCGAAADMTMRCMNRYYDQRVSIKPESSFSASLCLALCCYHASSWPIYVGKDFLYEALGITTEEEFKTLIKMPSWYTCYLDGFVDKRKKEAEQPSKKVKIEPHSVITDPETKFVSDAAKDPRTPIGLLAHRILSTGRLRYLQSLGYDAKLVLYTNVSHSLENTLIVAKKVHKK